MTKQLSTLICILFFGANFCFSQDPCASGRYAESVFTQFNLTSNLTYGQNSNWANSNTTLKLDFYEPANDPLSARPLIIWVHGGSFIGGSKTVIDYIEQFGRHYIYSTALPPPLCAAVLKSIELCRSESWRRDKLHSNIALFRHLAADLALLNSQTAIQGLVLGSSERALAASQQLKQAGIWLSAIRPPTVPQGSARLRITLSAQHSEQDIHQLVQQLRQLV